MTALDHYERRYGTEAERRQRAEARRSQRYAEYTERQRARGFEPVPYDRYGVGGVIAVGDLTEADMRRYGLPSKLGRRAAPWWM